jgi:hypothetical protein
VRDALAVFLLRMFVPRACTYSFEEWSYEKPGWFTPQCLTPLSLRHGRCFYAYCWALAHARMLGTTAERVVVCGDSAGGNLSTGMS